VPLQALLLDLLLLFLQLSENSKNMSPSVILTLPCSKLSVNGNSICYGLRGGPSQSDEFLADLAIKKKLFLGISGEKSTTK
jgi:hypothetical protein